jgi:inorganic pyrophosphatase
MKFPSAFVEDTTTVNVVVEATRGSRNKYALDEASGMFKLTKIFPAGMVLPYEFGFIPGTKAEDGDPVDVLLLTDDPTFPGCLLEARVVGIVKAEETEGGKTNRNDRVIAVATESLAYSYVKSLDDLDAGLLDDIIQFFQLYQKRSHKDEFKILGNAGPEQALELIRKHM